MSTNRMCHVIAMPYPGRGHVNPLMVLCKQLTFKKPDILITFVVTQEWLGLIGSDENRPPNIRFRTIPNCIPSEHGRSKDFPGFIRAVSTQIEEHFERLLDEIEHPVNVILADTYLIWMTEVGRRRNIRVASFWTMSASVFSVLFHVELFVQNGHFPVELSERGDEVVDYISGVAPIRLRDLPNIFSGTGTEVRDIALKCVSLVSNAQYLLFTSVDAIESEAITALKSKFQCPVYSVGPTIPYSELEDPNHNIPDYMNWLNSQHDNSVLYVSMGSFLSVSSTQMEEIILGVINSGVHFIWVSRGDTNTVLEKGCGDKGLVVPWCDQLRVLQNPAIGGFWTHCGFNSTLEAIYAGVPMLTFPIFWDQLPNSKMIVEDLKIGWTAKQGEHIVKREEIAKLVKSFMDEERNEVQEMRKRATNLRKACQAAAGKGGSSDANLDSFITDIS